MSRTARSLVGTGGPYKGSLTFTVWIAKTANCCNPIITLSEQGCSSQKLYTINYSENYIQDKSKIQVHKLAVLEINAGCCHKFILSRTLFFMFINKLVNISPILLVKRKAFPAYIFPKLDEKSWIYMIWIKVWEQAEQHTTFEVQSVNNQSQQPQQSLYALRSQLPHQTVYYRKQKATF